MSHDQMLIAFLAGDLDPAAARRFDEHLLGCEDCWQAVREDQAGQVAAELLRQPAPPGLADRVRLAVEVAAAAQPQPRQNRRRWPRWRVLAGAGALAAGLAAAVLAVVLPGGRAQEPAAVAAVVRYAQAMPHPGSGRPTVPVEVGHAVTVTAGGQAPRG